MSFDFTQEEEQKSQGNYGPVPAGSYVVLQMEVMPANPAYADPSSKFISRTSKGMKQIRCRFEVFTGTYAGVFFYQNISLPAIFQDVELSQGQKTAARIGGAQIKAICQAANKPMSMRDFDAMNGWKFPAKLRLAKNPFVGNNGQHFWNNELDRVVVPSDPEYNEVRSKREIINPNGAIALEEENYQAYQPSGNPFSEPVTSAPAKEGFTTFPENAADIDDCPF